MSQTLEAEVSTKTRTARVLLVEDDDEVRKALRAFLTEAGYPVDEATDGLEGLELFRLGRHDVVISDVQMPRLKGLALLRRLREVDPEAAVILMTGFPAVDLAVEGMREGASDFIVKPFSLKKIHYAVSRVVEQKRLQAENVHLNRRLHEQEEWTELRERVSQSLQQVAGLDALAATAEGNEALRGLKENLLQTLAEHLKACVGCLATRGSHGSEVLKLQAEGVGWRKTHTQAEGDDLLALSREVLAQHGSVTSPVAVALTLGPRVVGALALSRRKREFNAGEQRLLEQVARDAAVAIDNASVFHRIQSEHARNQRELELASRIQNSLLPERAPQVPGLRVRTLARGARSVSGDLYGFEKSRDGALRAFVGDVAGKGVPAALIMALTTNVFRELCGKHLSPDEILARANQALTGYLGSGPSYVTAVYARLHPVRLELQYARAGHEPVLVYRAADGRIDSLEARGSVLGMFADGQFTSETVSLARGDVVMLYTDGVIDATDSRGERYGIERLEALFKRTAPGGAPGVMEAYEADLQGFAGDAPLRDDLTMVVVELGFDGWEEVNVAGSRDEANRVKAQLYEFLEGLGLDSSSFQDLKFVIKEAVNNALEHGNGRDESKRLRLAWKAEDHKLLIRVGDEGRGFDPGRLSDPTASENVFKPRGRGVYLMRKMLDAVCFNEVGNEVELMKRLRSD